VRAFFSDFFFINSFFTWSSSAWSFTDVFQPICSPFNNLSNFAFLILRRCTTLLLFPHIPLYSLRFYVVVLIDFMFFIKLSLQRNRLMI